MKDYSQTYRILIIVAIVAIVFALMGIITAHETYFYTSRKEIWEMSRKLYVELSKAQDSGNQLLKRTQFNHGIAMLSGGITLLILSIYFYYNPDKPKGEQ